MQHIKKMKAGIIIPFRDTENKERSKELIILLDRINYICRKNKQDYQVAGCIKFIGIIGD